MVCFSYLAAAELWHVERFPPANHGAGVQRVEHSVAADGPMAGAALTALGIPTLLLTNGLGDDAYGAMVRGRLQSYGVTLGVSGVTDRPTPRITVVGDEFQTRTWFSHLPGVANALATLDLTPLTGAAYAYIDCYQLIEMSAVQAITAARAAGVPLLLNLGGSPLSSAVVAAIHNYPGLVVQTNVPDAEHADASCAAPAVLAATGADWAVVTAGAYGAVALSQAKRVCVPAFRATVRHTHCAGAAFSGGLLYGLLHRWPMSDSLDLACASGALRCERAQHEPMPTLSELRALIKTRERAIIGRRAS